MNAAKIALILGLGIAWMMKKYRSEKLAAKGK